MKRTSISIEDVTLDADDPHLVEDPAAIKYHLQELLVLFYGHEHEDGVFRVDDLDAFVNHIDVILTLATADIDYTVTVQ